MLQSVSGQGGGDIQNLWTFDVQVYPSDWSLDGRYLAYTANSQRTSADVWLLSMIGARKPAPLLQSPFVERHAIVLSGL
jgi:hypothetical protein